MLWVSKGNIPAVYRQPVFVFMLVLRAGAALIAILRTFMWWDVFELPTMPE